MEEDLILPRSLLAQKSSRVNFLTNLKSEKLPCSLLLCSQVNQPDLIHMAELFIRAAQFSFSEKSPFQYNNLPIIFGESQMTGRSNISP